MAIVPQSDHPNAALVTGLRIFFTDAVFVCMAQATIVFGEYPGEVQVVVSRVVLAGMVVVMTARSPA